jgi:hypothetical protein
MTTPYIRTEEHCCEVAWFDDLCGGDTAFLGVPDPNRRSTYEHCTEIVQLAEELGYDNILLPTSYMLGQETIPFAGAAAAQTTGINLLTAVRTGEIHPPMLARHLATLDHMLKGRLTVNIINSDLPGGPTTGSNTMEKFILISAWMPVPLNHFKRTGDRFCILEEFHRGQKKSQPSTAMYSSCGLNRSKPFVIPWKK